MTSFWQHRAPDVKTRRNIYILTLKCQVHNLTSGQGHVRSRVEASKSYFISVDASAVREKHIGTIPSTLYLFYQKLEKKTMRAHDLERPEGEVIGSKLHMGHREGPNVGMS